MLRELFDRVVRLAVDKKVTAGRRMRIDDAAESPTGDTTVVEANIRYPTDSGLCEDVVRVLRRGLKRLADVGVKLGFKLRSVRRSMSRRMREIAAALRLRDKDARNKALDKPGCITPPDGVYRRILRVTGRLVRQAARKQMKRLNDDARAAASILLEQIEMVIPRARQVLRQTRARIGRGVTDSKGKLISIFEPHAQILRRGDPGESPTGDKLHKPTNSRSSG